MADAKLTYEELLVLFYEIPVGYRNHLSWLCIHGVKFGRCTDSICVGIVERLKALDN